MLWLGYNNWLCTYGRVCVLRISINFQSLSFIRSHTFPYLPYYVFLLSHSLCSSLSTIPLVPDVTHMLWCGQGAALLPSSSSSPSRHLLLHSLSPPVVSAVIDMPPAINQHSSRLLLSEGTGLASLEQRAREGELIQLSSWESPTARHFISLWNFLTACFKTHHQLISSQDSHQCQTK